MHYRDKPTKYLFDLSNIFSCEALTGVGSVQQEGTAKGEIICLKYHTQLN